MVTHQTVFGPGVRNTAKLRALVKSKKMAVLILRGLLLFSVMVCYSIKIFDLVNNYFSGEYAKTFNNTGEQDGGKRVFERRNRGVVTADSNNNYCTTDNPFRKVCYPV